MPQEVINGVGKLAVRNPAALDSDAAAFITAATITNETQKTAVNDLVVDLKAAGLWTKMNALYPMVGGTAARHKWNLKDPRDLDAAYRLDFQGGWTHSSTGATPNGTNGYAKTFISTSVIGLNTGHLSFYSRTNDISNVARTELGAAKSVPDSYTGINLRSSDGQTYLRWNNGLTNPNAPLPNTLGFYVASRTASNAMAGYKNGAVIAGFSTTAASNSTTTIKMYLGATNLVGTSNTNTDVPAQYSNKECAFASIGSGLTQIESQLLYQIVEKFQAVLSRNINASQTFYYNKNYSNEVNAFIFNGGITDATQMSATNTLVNTLKTAGIWTKMKAVYPMVGGTSTSHKFNLVNPIDATSAYALTYVGGWTFGSSGATPNGSNSHANTNLIAGSVLTTTSAHLSFYTPSNITGYFVDIGARNGGVSGNPEIMIISRDLNFNSMYTFINSISNARLLTSVPTSAGFSFSTRNSTTHSNFKNGIKLGSITSNSGAVTSYPIFIGANNSTNTTESRSTRTCSFASIGDGLTDAEALTFYNAVQAFQTTLGRQV